MAGVDSGNDCSLEQTPTWAIAVVCFGICGHLFAS